MGPASWHSKRKSGMSFGRSVFVAGKREWRGESKAFIINDISPGLIENTCSGM
jgi:hypothetical protein